MKTVYPNGNTLICESAAKRIFEVTPECETVWEYVGCGPRAYRYPYDYCAPTAALGQPAQASVTPPKELCIPPDGPLLGERFVYKTVGGVQLSLGLFKPDRCEDSAALPCIVFFHGGGWRGGAPGQFQPHCLYLASRGMVSISAEYRLTGVHGTSPRECVMDGKSAIRWVRRHAGRFGIDPGRIAAGGGSAGGHVASACATLAGFDEPDEDPTISSRPDALVLFNPVFDNGPDGYGHDRVAEYWKEFSPLHNVAPGVPPAIVFFGSEDGLVPVATAREFKKRMEDAGSQCDLWIYDGQPHAFFNYRGGENPYYYATVYEADRFLTRLSYLQGAPTIQNAAVAASHE